MDLRRRAGIYLHVPFCRRKCPYCSFASVVPRPGQVGRYLRALHAQLRALAALPQVRGTHLCHGLLGGGTPSLLDPADLAGLLADCRSHFAFAADEPEVSVEVNPGTIDAAGLERLRRAGCNRLSIGVSPSMTVRWPCSAGSTRPARPGPRCGRPEPPASRT